MLFRVLGYLEANWDALQTGRPTPRRFSFLMHSRHRVSIFILTDSDPLPLFVARFPRDKEGETGLRQEWDALATIRSLASPEFHRLVPRPVALLDNDEGLINIETALHGESMRTPKDLVRDQAVVGKHFHLVSSWLLDLEKETHDGRWISAMAVGDTIVQKIQTYCDKVELSADGIQYVRYLVPLLEALPAEGFPLLVQHGDLTPSNILLSAGDISGVVDWEYARSAAPPIYDWFSFLLLYCCNYWQQQVHQWLFTRALSEAVKTIVDLSLIPGHPIVDYTLRFCALQ